MPTIVYAFFFFGLLIAAGLWDFWRLELPDLLSVALAAGGVLYSAQFHGLDQAALHVAIGVGVWVCGLILTMLGFWGGGDAKLLAAVTVWVGWPDLGQLVIWIILMGGVWGLALLPARRLAACADRGPGSARWPRALTRGEGMPYALAIASGAVICRHSIGL